MKVWEATVEVLKETDNPAIMWGDNGLLHMVADKLGWKHEGPKTTRRVLAALNKTPGILIKKKSPANDGPYGFIITVFVLPQ